MILILTLGRKVKVEIVLQVPVSLILVTCSVTWELRGDDAGAGDDEEDGEDGEDVDGAGDDNWQCRR